MVGFVVGFSGLTVVMPVNGLGTCATKAPCSDRNWSGIWLTLVCVGFGKCTPREPAKRGINEDAPGQFSLKMIQVELLST